MTPLKSTLFFLLSLVSTQAFCQYTDVINSNRPGVSRSAFSVGTNVAQVEIGPYSIKEEHSLLKNDVSGFGIDFAARYGLLFEELELNIEGTYQNDTFTDYRSTISAETKRANFKFLAVGAKYLVYDPYKNAEEDKPNLYSWKANRQFKWKSLIPAVSVYLGANYDTKPNPYTYSGIEGFSPKAMIATQNNFSGGWVLVTNLIFDRLFTKLEDVNGNPIIVNGKELKASEFQYIITLTRSLNQNWVIFGEAHGIQSDFYADNLFRFGGAYLASKDFQLDTALTFNTKDTPSVFSVNIGASYRLDFHKDKNIDGDNGTSAKNEGKRRANRKGKKKNKGADSIEKINKRQKKDTDFFD